MGNTESKATKLKDSCTEAFSVQQEFEIQNSNDQKLKALQEEEEFQERKDQTCEAFEEEDPDTRFTPLEGDRAQKRLIERAKKGNSKALSKVIELYYKDILYFAIKKVGVQEGEDVTQQTIVRIIKSITKLKDASKARSWIISITYSECMDHMRKKAKRKTVASDQESLNEEQVLFSEKNKQDFLPEKILLDTEARNQVLDVIDDLPGTYADCMRMYYYGGLSYREIANNLGITWIKVRNDLFRGRKLFKERYEEQTGAAYKLSATSAASFAVLAQVFEAEQAHLVTADTASHLLSFANQQIALVPHFSFTSVLGALGNKVVLGAAATTVVVGGVGAYVLSTPPQESEPLVAQAPAEIEPTAQEEVPASISEETPINTLVDMVGAQEASELEALSVGLADKNRLEEYIKRLGMTKERDASEYDYHYAIYELRKQDKQLLVFERVDNASGTIEVRYQFGIQQEIPYLLEVTFMF